MLSCNVCREEKTFEEFSPRNDRPRGYHYLCKTCQNEKARVGRRSGIHNVDREAAKIRSRLWRKNNPGHRNALKAAYKASKRSATPVWLSEDQKQEIINLYKEAKEKSENSFQVDHIVPLRGTLVCGLHVPWNLQILSTQENRKKSNSWDS